MPSIIEVGGGGSTLSELLIGGSGWVPITTARNTTFTAPSRCLVVGFAWGHGTSGSGASTSTTGTRLYTAQGNHADWDGMGTSSTSMIVAVLERGQTCTFNGEAADSGRYAYGALAAYKPITD